MSAAVLAQAVRDTILANVQINGENIDRETCDVMFDEHPKPTSGQLFLSVWFGGIQNDSGDFDLSEFYSVNITVSLKIGDIPEQDQGIEAWVKANEGLDAVGRKIIALIHQNQNIRLLANGATSPPAPYAFTATQTGFSTTTQFTGAQAPVPRRAGWFNGNFPTGVENENALALAGVSQTLTFGKVLRSQAIAGQT